MGIGVHGLFFFGINRFAFAAPKLFRTFDLFAVLVIYFPLLLSVYIPPHR